MSGARFVLSILAVIVAYSLGVYVLSNWNRSDLQPDKPSTEFKQKVVTKSQGEKETKSKTAETKWDESGRASKPVGTKPVEKYSGLPVEKSGEKRLGDRALAENGRQADQPAHQNTEPRSSDIIPSFDVIRVEPTGDAVIAGRSKPGWIVRVEAGKKLIGEAKADRDGQWVIISDKALDPGQHELGLRSIAPEGKNSIISKQKVRVAIKKNKSAKPRIVLAEPGQPERIVQSGEPDLPKVAEKTPISSDADKNIADTKRNSVVSGNGKSSGLSAEGSSAAEEIVTAERKLDTAAKPDKIMTGPAESISEVVELVKDQIKIAENSDEINNVQSDKSLDSDLSSDPVKGDGIEELRTVSSDLKNSDSKVAPSEKAGSSLALDKNIGTAALKPENDMADKSVAAVKDEPKEPVNDSIEKKKTIIGAGVESIPGQNINTEGSERSSSGTSSKAIMKPIPVPLVSVRSVEYERSVENRGFLSLEGEGLPGARVNVFLNDKHLGSTKADSSGVWRFYRSVVIKPGQYIVQAKQVDQSGKILALASKSFERILPKAITIGSIKSSSGEVEKDTTPVAEMRSERDLNDRKAIVSNTKQPVSTTDADKEQLNTKVGETTADKSKSILLESGARRDQSEKMVQENTKTTVKKEPDTVTPRSALNITNSKNSGKKLPKQKPVENKNINSDATNRSTVDRIKNEIASESSESSSKVQNKIAAVEDTDEPAQKNSVKIVPKISDASEARKSQNNKVAAVGNIDSNSKPKIGNEARQKDGTEIVGAGAKKTGSKKVKRRKTVSKSKRKSRTARTYKSRTWRKNKRRRKLSLSRSRLSRQKHNARIRRHWMKISKHRARKRKQSLSRSYGKRRRSRSHCTR